MKNLPAASPQPSITQILNVMPVLPGEDRGLYQRDLAATIQELEAVTPIQHYFAEKIFECLWWLRRYEAQKRMMLIETMADLLDDQYSSMRSAHRQRIFDLLVNPSDEAQLQKLLKSGNYSLESLQQKAFSKCEKKLIAIDQQVAICAKTLASFKLSFELAVNRKINRERLTLQNDLVRRDLNAIEHEQPKKTKSQPD